MEVLKRSVFVESKEKEIKRVEEALSLSFGADCYSSVVGTTGGFFITFVSVEDATNCAEIGLFLADEDCPVRKVGSREIIATFFDVPEFVLDGAITEKLIGLKCELKSDVIWDRKNGKYYGQRSIKLSLPEGVTSLPYSLRLADVMGLESSYTVRHERQAKVCNKCLSSGHLYKDCPQFLCRFCGVQGHVARVCPNKVPKVLPVEDLRGDLREDLRENLREALREDSPTVPGDIHLGETTSTTSGEHPARPSSDPSSPNTFKRPASSSDGDAGVQPAPQRHPKHRMPPKPLSKKVKSTPVRDDPARHPNGSNMDTSHPTDTITANGTIGDH